MSLSFIDTRLNILLTALHLHRYNEIAANRETLPSTNIERCLPSTSVTGRSDLVERKRPLTSTTASVLTRRLFRLLARASLLRGLLGSIASLTDRTTVRKREEGSIAPRRCSTRQRGAVSRASASVPSSLDPSFRFFFSEATKR